MVPIYEELWNIFTYYSLHGTLSDPFHMNASQLQKLCKDALIFTKKGVEAVLDAKHCQVLVREVSFQHAKKTAEATVAKRRGVASPVPKSYHQLFLNFPNFLEVVAIIGQKCYPSATGREDAFEAILMNNILPFSCRRARDVLEYYVDENIEVATIINYYERPLTKIFAFYASDSASPDGTRKSNFSASKTVISKTDAVGKSPKRNSMPTMPTMLSASPSAFRSPSPRSDAPPSSSMMLVATDERKMSMSMLTTGVAETLSKSPPRINQRMHSAIGYTDFMRFMNDTGLGNALQTTTYDLTHVFLTVMQAKDFHFASRNLDFSEFCEVLVKCAVIGFRDKMVSIGDKTHALFMFLSRQVDDVVSVVTRGKGSCCTGENAAFVSQLTDGIRELNNKFQRAWSQDNYRDYLADLPPPPEPTGIGMLEHLSNVPFHLAGQSELDEQMNYDDGSPSYKIKGSIDREMPPALVKMRSILKRRPKLSKNMSMMVD